MAYTEHPVVVSGQTWTASNQMTYVRANLIELWKGVAAGDMDYYNGPTTKARLSAPASLSLLKHTSTAPAWLTKGNALQVLRVNAGATDFEFANAAGLHAVGLADFAPGGQSTTGTTFVDITGATLNLSLSVTCTVLLLAVVSGYHNTAGRSFMVRGVINGTADPQSNLPFNGAESRNESIPYIYRATGVPSGTRTVKLQFWGDAGGTAYVERGRLIALAFTE